MCLLNYSVQERKVRDVEKKKRHALIEARRRKQMTQQAVADHLGISTRHYRHIEAGDRTGDFEIWDALEDLFGIHQRELRQMANPLSDPTASPYQPEASWQG
jgi:ribosome-binding protein aMBF1 (putative translation factor)